MKTFSLPLLSLVLALPKSMMVISRESGDPHVIGDSTAFDETSIVDPDDTPHLEAKMLKF